MAFKDLREYLKVMEEEGELQRIGEEVDWNLEVGAVIRHAYDLQAPAPLFEKIKGYPPGYRILGAPAGPSRTGRFHARIALAMGIKADTPLPLLIEEYLTRRKNRIKPRLVSSGPCKENILIGDAVDLLRFPAPFVHDGDGGRFIGTYHAIVTKDPDTDWINWGMYRLMIHDRNTMGGIIAPSQHIGMMYFQKYEARNQPMPFAAVIGAEPVTPIMAASYVPAGVDEADVIGGIRGEPLEVVKCETVDLEVPATAEIVIEGEVLPHERRSEGPYGEYTGYRSETIGSPKPVFRVTAITHRNDPILPASCVGVPSEENECIMSVTLAGDLLEHLRSQGFPVKMVHIPPQCSLSMVVVSTKTPYPEFAKRIAFSIWASKSGVFMYWVVVVDEDVDVSNMNEVLHALVTRCHPARGIFTVPNAPGYPFLNTFADPHDRLIGRVAYCLFDCTWPKDWKLEDIPVKASFDVSWPKEIQDKVLSKWKLYGYKE